MPPVRRSLRRAALSGAWILLALAATTTASAQEELLQELKRISSLRVEGRHRVGKGTLQRVMKTRGPSLWPWREVPLLRFDYLRSDTAAIRQLYRRYGFLDAQVEYQVASGSGNDNVAVTFHIREGEQSTVREVRLAGVTAFTDRELGRKLRSRPGRPFDPAYLQLDTLRIASLYQEKGFFPHVVASYARDPSDSLRVDVAYQIREGDRFHFGSVTVQGAAKVEERLIRRELSLPPGKVYQRSRVQRSQERLYETGLFSQVQIDPTPDSARARMDFDLRVRERRPRWIDAGIGVGSGTDERFRVAGEWGHRNMFGRGMQGLFNTRLAYNYYSYLNPRVQFQRWHTEVSVLEPWLFGSRTRGQITPYYERNDDRGDRRWLVRQEFRGINFQLRRELNRFARFTLTQENLWVFQDLQVNPGLVSPVPDSTLDSLERAVVRNYTTQGLVLGFERDTRDNPFSPQLGATTLATAQVAGGPFSGNSSFWKFQVASSWYTPMRNGWTLATRALAGVIDPFGPVTEFSPNVGIDPEVNRVPLEDRFRIGGVNSIRAYDENSIPGSGGLAVIQGNVEVRIPTGVRLPILGSLGFEGFVDVGNVWARPEYMLLEHFWQTDDSDANSVRYVVGVGPRIDLPVGPLRLDVSWRVLPAAWQPRVQVAIGPSF